MIEWLFASLRQYPEIAIFLALGLGYYFGGFTFKGIGLGSVTATLLAAVIIGQIGITISTPLKATVFLMFLFAVGYGVGPQFVRGVAKDGLPQAIFSLRRKRSTKTRASGTIASASAVRRPTAFPPGCTRNARTTQRCQAEPAPPISLVPPCFSS